MTTLETELKASAEQLAKEKTHAAELQKEKVNLDKKIIELTQARGTLEQRISQLEKELQDHVAALQTMPSSAISQEEYNELIGELEDAQASNTEKDGHLRSLRSQVESHARTISDLQEQLEKATFASHVASSGDSEQVAKLYEERMTQLETKRKQLEDENVEYQTLAEELETEVSRLLKQEQDLQQEMHDTKTTLEKQITDLRSQHNQQSKALEKRIKGTEDALTEAQKKAQEQREQLQHEYEQLQQERENLEQENRRMQAETQKLHAEIAAERKDKQKAQQSLASLEAQLEELISKKSKFMCF